jgi:P-type conjugative transfer protein TrbJ
MKKLLIVAMMLTTPAYGVAGTVLGNGGSTFPEQIVQETTAMMQYARQAQQLQQQIQMVSDQAMNLATIPQSLWNTALLPIQDLANLEQQMQGYSYGLQNTISQFSNQYPGWNSNGYNYNGQLSTLDNSTLQSIKQALQVAGLNPNGYTTAQSAINSAAAAGATSTGRLQVLQAATAIAGTEASQANQLLATQQQYNAASAKYMATRFQATTNNQQATEQFFSQPAGGLSVQSTTVGNGWVP